MIVETKTFYSSTDQRTEKCVMAFDGAGMLLTEERFDESGNRTARLTHKNDTVNQRCLETVFERWGKTGYGQETTRYTYDANHTLIRVTDLDPRGSIMRISQITNNEKGHPVSLLLTDAGGNPFGKETGTYLYERNSVVNTVFDNDDNKLSADTMVISLKDAHLHPAADAVYNEQGDLVKWTSKQSSGAKDFYEAEYVYDAFGNCTDEVIYKVEVKETKSAANAKPKKKRERRFERQYTY